MTILLYQNNFWHPNTKKQCGTATSLCRCNVFGEYCLLKAPPEDMRSVVSAMLSDRILGGDTEHGDINNKEESQENVNLAGSAGKDEPIDKAGDPYDEWSL